MQCREQHGDSWERLMADRRSGPGGSRLGRLPGPPMLGLQKALRRARIRASCCTLNHRGEHVPADEGKAFVSEWLSALPTLLFWDLHVHPGTGYSASQWESIPVCPPVVGDKWGSYRQDQMAAMHCHEHPRRCQAERLAMARPRQAQASWTRARVMPRLDDAISC